MEHLKVLIIMLVALVSPRANAELRFSNAFGDHMILQQQMPIRVWGWADVGAEVTVAYADAQAKAKAGEDGRWQVELPAMDADNQAHELVVISGNDKVELQDVLLGEVWICSGQSNMFMGLKRAANPDEEIAAADFPMIRIYKPERIMLESPQDDAQPVPWQAVAPNNMGQSSAVGYFFGRELHQQLNVPIGLIHVAWGATRIEPWTPPSGFRQVKALATLSQAVDSGELMTGTRDRDTDRATAIYNGMVAGLAAMTVRGVIWYQGESNADDGLLYDYLTESLVKGWRTEFNNENLPFYWVQLAPFKRGHTGNPEGGGNGPIRDAQRRALRLPYTGMVVTNDIGDAEDIHPKNKQDVGRRLALWALAMDYGKDVAYSGPLYKSIEIKGDKAYISFDHAESGLMVGKKEGEFHMDPVQPVDGGELKGFSIRDEDGKWYWAQAQIEGQQVVVWSNEVSKPGAVRYDYDSLATGNLYNQDLLPASPFSTTD